MPTLIADRVFQPAYNSTHNCWQAYANLRVTLVQQMYLQDGGATTVVNRMTRLSPHCILNLFLVFSCRWALSHSPFTHSHTHTHTHTHTTLTQHRHSGDYCILSMFSEPMICVHLSVIVCSQGLGKAGSGGVSWPPKIWSWGQTLHMALMKNQRIMLHDKTFWPWPVTEHTEQ